MQVYPAPRRSIAKLRVIMLSAEDDTSRTIVPRLDAAAADRENIYQITHTVIETERGREQRWFTLEDVEALDHALVRYPHVRLITIDPLSAYVGSTDSHNNSEVRGLLAPLVELAADHNVAVVAITHLNKGGVGGSPMYRATGSLAFIAASRAAYAITADPNDEQNRIFMPLKNNLAPAQPGLSFRIQPDPVDDQKISVRWGGPVELDAAELFATPTKPLKLDDCIEWLELALADGPVPQETVAGRVREAGYSWRTVERAKKALGIRSKKDDFKGGWTWSMPTKH